MPSQREWNLEWKVRHRFKNSAGRSNLERRKVYVNKDGIESGCTEPRNRANTRMLNRMQAFAEGFYWNVCRFGDPILVKREHKLVDLITKNHLEELEEGYYIRRRERLERGFNYPEEFHNWFVQEFPTINQDKFFDALYAIGPEKICTYLKQAIEVCDNTGGGFGTWWSNENYKRGIKGEDGLIGPPPKEQLIKEIEKFTQQEELK